MHFPAPLLWVWTPDLLWLIEVAGEHDMGSVSHCVSVVWLALFRSGSGMTCMRDQPEPTSVGSRAVLAKPQAHKQEK